MENNQLVSLIKVLEKQEDGWEEESISRGERYPWELHFEKLIGLYSIEETTEFVRARVSKRCEMPHKPGSYQVNFSIGLRCSQPGHGGRGGGFFVESYTTNEPVMFYNGVLSVPDSYYLGDKLALRTEQVTIPSVGSLLLQVPVKGMESKTPIVQLFNKITLAYVKHSADSTVELLKKEAESAKHQKNNELQAERKRQLEREKELNEVVQAIISPQ